MFKLHFLWPFFSSCVIISTTGDGRQMAPFSCNKNNLLTIFEDLYTECTALEHSGFKIGNKSLTTLYMQK